MVHQVSGNRVSIAKHKKVLHIPRNFSEPSVIGKDGTAAKEMSHFMTQYNT